MRGDPLRRALPRLRSPRWRRNDSVAELKLGYKASAEQFAPRELVALAVAAEARAVLAGWDDGSRRADQAAAAWHVGADAGLPLQPGRHRAGVRHHGLPVSGPDFPRGGHRRVAQ